MPLTSVNSGDTGTAAHHNEIYDLLKTTTAPEWITFTHKGADIVSAATLSLGGDGNYFDVTGTAGITAISLRQAGTLIILQFDGAVAITHNATSLRLIGATNYTTVAGDILCFISEGSGNWREFARASAGATTFADGTEGAPGVSFSADPDTGIRRSAANEMRLVTAGADRWTVDANGNLVASDDAAYDIGASGATRPRHVFASGTLTVPSIAAATSIDRPMIAATAFVSMNHSHASLNAGGLLAEAALNLTDLTVGDVTTTRHGFMPKAPNSTTLFFRGDASWATTGGVSGGQSATATITGDITTTSTSFTDATGLTVTITTTGGDVLVWFSGAVSIGSAAEIDVTLNVDGSAQGGTRGLAWTNFSSASNPVTISFVWRVAAPSAGSHTYKIQWKSPGAGTATMYGNPNSTIVVQELPH
jgi:hypothetical protein